MQKIFISLASYIDPMLLFTIKSAIENAKYPDRLFFGVVDQSFKNQRSVFEALSFSAQVRYCHIYPEDTFGVSWARSLAYSLYDGEEYILQVDSHTYFEEGWDESLIGQISSLQNVSAKPIISTYPYAFEFKDDKPTYIKPEGKTVLVLRPHPDTPLSKENPVMRFLAKHMFTDKPVLGCHIAAGFLFCGGDFVEAVPYDPYLYFHGEEQSLALRAFTRGWDIYHPTWIPLYHLYKQANTAYDTHHWHGEVKDKRALDVSRLQDRAKLRLQKLINGELTDSVYGLGNIRSLDEFKQISGIDYKNSVIIDPYEGLLC